MTRIRAAAAVLACCCAAGLLAGTAARPAAGARVAADDFIVFADRPASGGKMQLFRMRGDGTGRRRLTRNGSSDHDADISSDGRRIVFLSYTPGIRVNSTDEDVGEDVAWVMSADGSGLRVLGVSGYIGWPRWSPKNDWIAFQEECGFGSGGIPDDTCITVDVVRPNGSARRSFGTDGTGSSRESIEHGTAWSWSGDGARIAFERARVDGDVVDVGVADVARRTQRLVARVGAEPASSPREPLLAVVRGDAIALVRLDGKMIRWLSRPKAGSRDRSPSWSPDGRRIAFWRWDKPSFVTDRPTLMVVDRRASIVRVERAVAPIWLHRIVWSPDGTQLLASLAHRTTVSSPWIYRLDLARTTGLVRLAAGTPMDWGRPR